MDGIFSTNQKSKLNVLTAIHIISTVLTAVLLIIFAFKRILINYANIYNTDRASGIEYSPLYSTLSIGLSVLLVFLLICALIKFSFLKQQIIALCIGIVIVIIIICSSVFSLHIPKSNEYLSYEMNDKVSQYFPIDKYEYDGKRNDFYYFKEVSIGNTYWIGSCSYKDFAEEDTSADLTEDVSDSTVFMNYYYLKDSSGKRVKDYVRNKNIYDAFSVEDYITEKRGENYRFYEYDDCYEFIFTDSDRVFYLSASKNKKTEYEPEDIIDLSQNFMQGLEADLSDIEININQITFADKGEVEGYY